MACTSFSLPTSPQFAPTTEDIFKEHVGLRRSHSVKDLHNGPRFRRSYSDNNLVYPINRIQATATQQKLRNSRSLGIFPFQFSSSILPNLFDPEASKEMNMVEKDMNIEESSVDGSKEEERKRSNWMERLLEIRSHWINRQQKESVGEDIGCEEGSIGDCDYGGDEGGCAACYGSEEEGGVGYDRKTFSRLLVRVPWSDTKQFSQLAFLCNMAYVIPAIKAKDLRKYYGLQLVTSSLEKKAEAAAIKAKLDEDSVRVPQDASAADESSSKKDLESEKKRPIRSSLAYEIAASAASYLQSRTKGLLFLSSEPQQEGDGEVSCENGAQPHKEGEDSPRLYNQEVAAYMAASTMTAVVAAGEREKQEAARALQSLHSSPCEWFVCDDLSTCTRCFVIQGSDSLSSWQANLFFEPTKFEGTDVLVHRGIYEAAKGIYEQFMPEIIDHLNTYGDRAKLQFTGHSLGGSLSLLVNLMLLTRKVIKPSTLRPVVTFGSPFVFCGGEAILDELGLDESHVHCVMMHRDIVPRAFSCNYPDHVAVLLKRLNGAFSTHSCLIKNKLLYSPLGKLFILQPDEKSSPPHPLLPPGSALYVLDKAHSGYSANALRTFLNSPHPLETLSDPTAYGSNGTILRDHDSSNYLKAINGVLRQRTKMVVRRVRERRNLLWPLLTSPSPHTWTLTVT
ncbi:phospholipase A1 PLIP1, chloroplastic isoform X2 [Corylus avellana]|uniref:phospholipase A1 PLIP1, chloroplastic isoform X2 n=1 Tax=Corylus avellana TaxID=13451 RepID=UPI00286A0DB2|nr:phospholipase A1 PLIP1, chloroplastic isoform X2 [Corylus avellana]